MVSTRFARGNAKARSTYSIVSIEGKADRSPYRGGWMPACRDLDPQTRARSQTQTTEIVSLSKTEPNAHEMWFQNASCRKIGKIVEWPRFCRTGKVVRRTCLPGKFGKGWAEMLGLRNATGGGRPDPLTSSAPACLARRAGVATKMRPTKAGRRPLRQRASTRNPVTLA